MLTQNPPALPPPPLSHTFSLCRCSREPYFQPSILARTRLRHASLSHLYRSLPPMPRRTVNGLSQGPTPHTAHRKRIAHPPLFRALPLTYANFLQWTIPPSVFQTHPTPRSAHLSDAAIGLVRAPTRPLHSFQQRRGTSRRRLRRHQHAASGHCYDLHVHGERHSVGIGQHEPALHQSSSSRRGGDRRRCCAVG